MNSQEKKIVIPCSKSYDFVYIKNIIRCEGMQNYTKVFLDTGDTIISSCNVGIYGKGLSDFGFFSCHKSHVVNTSKIVRYHKEGLVEMVDASVIPISRRKRDEFLEQIVSGNKVL
jgi:two-component system LytT family response regulator